MKTKKCSKCRKVRSLVAFCKTKANKDGLSYVCRECSRIIIRDYLQTERGYLAKRYNDMKRNDKSRPSTAKCYISLDELYAAFEKHKSIYGMRSAWGPGIDYPDQHLPITMIVNGDTDANAWTRGDGKRVASNLSIDRLNSNKGYTLQNIIFIRNDENARKKDTSYEDCKIQIKLYEERFIKMKAI